MSEETIFATVMEKPTPTERAAYLAVACAGDPELRRRVEALLRAHEQSGDLLDPTDATSPASGPTVDHPTPRPITEGPDSQIGPYKLREKIGEGGMGIVYLAEQEKPVRRRVALKIIKPGMDTEQVVARFEAERQALALMDHPCIARVFDAGATNSGRPYFVMELVKGVPITDYCDTVHLTPGERLKLFIPVCQAIQHAHQKGIIHRDFKPSNVLVTIHDGKPVPKIIDFGIAKATEQRLTERSLFTQHGAILGTLEYMSPEQAEMSALDVHTRTDVYALGVMLYELLTGTTPLERARLREAGYGEILRRIRDEEPPKPSTRLSESKDTLASISAQRKTEPARLTKLVRGELDWIVMKAIEKDRTRRYETANGFARDIERYLHDEPVEASPPSAAYRMRKYARKHRAALFTAGAFAGLLVLAAAVSTWQAYLSTKARNEAQDAYRQSRLSEEKAKEQEAQARLSAAESEAVLKFFQDQVLSAARPEGQEGGLGKDATIRKAVDAAEPKIATAFTDQPTVEASIRNALGQTYMYLGEPALAIRQVDRAQELQTAKLGSDHPDTLSSRDNLVSAYWAAGRTAEAIALNKENLRLYSSKIGPDHPDVLRSRNNLACTYRDAGRTAEAIMLFEENLKLSATKLGHEHPETLRTMNNLASAYDAAGQFARSELILRQCLSIRERIQPDDWRTFNTRSQLGGSLLGQKKFAEVEPLILQGYEGMVAREAKIPAPSKKYAAEAAERVVKLYEAWGKQDEAAEWRKRLGDAKLFKRVDPEPARNEPR